MSLKLNKEEKKILDNLLYEEENNDTIIEYLKSTSNLVFLHCFADEYNWDDGLEIPIIISNNIHCDLGTALLLFFRAEGEYLLEQSVEFKKIDEASPTWEKQWKEFLINLYNKILNGEYKNKQISFGRDWSKVEKYKLLKKNPSIPKIFLEKSDGMC